MPQSKTHSSRAKKLAKRRADQQRRAVPQTYVVMLDQLRAVLNKRFYEEQGFPHLEILAERYKGARDHGTSFKLLRTAAFLHRHGSCHGQCALCRAQVLDGAA